jgi:hypothetical protein
VDPEGYRYSTSRLTTLEEVYDEMLKDYFIFLLYLYFIEGSGGGREYIAG